MVCVGEMQFFRVKFIKSTQMVSSKKTNVCGFNVVQVADLSASFRNAILIFAAHQRYYSPIKHLFQQERCTLLVRM